MKSGIEICCCGAELPPSVSLQAESIRIWLALLECPACGSAVSAMGYEPVGALALVGFALSFSSRPSRFGRRRALLLEPPLQRASCARRDADVWHDRTGSKTRALEGTISSPPG